MLVIDVPEIELFDENKCEFVTIKHSSLQLEHSLVSISKWEAKWKKPFLSKETKTNEEFLDYVRCMTINKNVNDMVYATLSDDAKTRITDYINDAMSATTFSDNPNQKPSREIITSEIIYYWMVAYQIPFECEKWHINRLINLIRVCSLKNAPPKKMSRHATMQHNNALNAARRQRLHTRG